MAQQNNIKQPELPSADLINYRFDKLDETNKEILARFDLMSTTFVPRDEINLMAQQREEKESAAHKLIDASIDEIKKNISEDRDNRKWFNRAVIGAVVSALFVAIGSLIVGLLLHASTH